VIYMLSRLARSEETLKRTVKGLKKSKSLQIVITVLNITTLCLWFGLAVIRGGTIWVLVMAYAIVVLFNLLALASES
jgi:hypothetical protein